MRCHQVGSLNGQPESLTRLAVTWAAATQRQPREMPQMSPGRFLQGSAYTALAALMGTIALPDVVSAREEGEERNAMQIRGERVQQANAQRQEQRAQRAEQ